MHMPFPSINPNKQYDLPVSKTHTLYIEECGNSAGLPVLVLHQGPGMGGDNIYRRLFDPEKFRIITFDQRGSGRSKPYGEIEENTTNHLLEDINTIKEYLKIDKWIVFGHAWGSTLALLYAQHHPSDLLSLILVSTYLARQEDIDWLYRYGANRIFADFWHELVSHTYQDEHQDLVKSYYDNLTGSDDLLRMATAKAWSLWHAKCFSLQPKNSLIEKFSSPHFALGFAKLSCYYAANNYFIEENQILKNIDRIKDLPGHIIHGRFNIISPLNASWQLHKNWPLSELYIIRESGHSIREKSLIDSTIFVTNLLAHELS